MKKEAAILLRLSLGFVFIYAAVSSITNPSSWMAFLPSGLNAVWTPQNWLILFSVCEVALAMWILSGWKVFWSSLIASALLFAIVLANLMAFDIVFRDLALGLAAMALSALSHES